MIAESAEVRLGFFEGEFADVEACCMEIYVANIAEFDRVVFGAIDGVSGWPDRLRVAAYAASCYVRERPLESRFDFVEMLECGEEAQVYRDRYVQRIVDLIDEGRVHLDDPDSHGKELAQAAFGAIYELLARKFQRGDAERATIALYVPELMCVAIQPYVGVEAARRELTIPPPAWVDSGNVR
jgi:hypothetical protein